MFKDSYQEELLSIFYSVGQRPLEIWNCVSKSGRIRRLLDEDINAVALDIQGTSVASTYIECPPNPKMALGISMPILVLLFKNLNKYFNFVVKVKGSSGSYRYFKASNFTKKTSIKHNHTMIPLKLHEKWNTVVIDLDKLMKYCYNESMYEVSSIKINANCRLRRVYFSKRIYDSNELKDEYKIPGKDVVKL